MAGVECCQVKTKADSRRRTFFQTMTGNVLTEMIVDHLHRDVRHDFDVELLVLSLIGTLFSQMKTADTTPETPEVLQVVLVVATMTTVLLLLVMQVTTIEGHQGMRGHRGMTGRRGMIGMKLGRGTEYPRLANGVWRFNDHIRIKNGI